MTYENSQVSNFDGRVQYVDLIVRCIERLYYYRMIKDYENARDMLMCMYNDIHEWVGTNAKGKEKLIGVNKMFSELTLAIDKHAHYNLKRANSSFFSLKKQTMLKRDIEARLDELHRTIIGLLTDLKLLVPRMLAPRHGYEVLRSYG